MKTPLIYKRWPAKHPDRIQLYSANSPNGIKVSTALEEMALAYEPHTVNIFEGEQFTDEYKSINPNSKIPAILDPDGANGKPVTIMESGAILIYLAEKSGKLLSSDPIEKNACLQWLFFQVGHVGPMFGQFEHFDKFAVDKCQDPYPKERYRKEAARLLGVLEARLADRDFIMGSGYSIADIATFPWVRSVKEICRDEDYLGMAEFRNVGSWLARCVERPASVRGINVCVLV
jgi:GST-like protein